MFYTALKKGYKIVKQTITLETEEEKDIEVVMKKVIRKGKQKHLYVKLMLVTELAKISGS